MNSHTLIRHKSCLSQVRTEMSSPLSSPLLISSPINFPSSPDSLNQKQGTGKAKNERQGEKEDKSLLWVEEEKQMRIERERKMREDEENRMRAEAQRQLEYNAKRQAEEAERQMRAEAERQLKIEADRQLREDRERLIREDGERQMKREAERRMREEAEAQQREDSERLTKLMAAQKKDEEKSRVVNKVGNMKKIEIRSSSSSLSEDDSLTIAQSHPHQPFSVSPINNLKSSTSVSGPPPPRASVTLHSDSSQDTDASLNTAAMVKKASPMPSSSAADLHVKPSVSLESDSTATSDYSESDIGSPAVVRRAVPVDQVQGSSESPGIVRKAIPVVDQNSSHSSPGSETESEASVVRRQAIPVADRLSETESEAGIVRRAIPVPATDSDSAASSLASGLPVNVKIFVGFSEHTIFISGPPQQMTRVEASSDSSTVTEDEEESPPIRRAVPVVPATSSSSDSNLSDSDADSDSAPALPMTRVNRTLSVISEASSFNTIQVVGSNKFV